MQRWWLAALAVLVAGLLLVRVGDKAGDGRQALVKWTPQIEALLAGENVYERSDSGRVRTEGVAADTSADVPAVRVRVSAGPGLAARIPAGAPLFVFVRIPGQPGPPIAVETHCCGLLIGQGEGVIRRRNTKGMKVWKSLEDRTH